MKGSQSLGVEVLLRVERTQLPRSDMFDVHVEIGRSGIVVENQKGELSIPQVTRCRIYHCGRGAYFDDGDLRFSYSANLPASVKALALVRLDKHGESAVSQSQRSEILSWNRTFPPLWSEVDAVAISSLAPRDIQRKKLFLKYHKINLTSKGHLRLGIVMVTSAPKDGADFISVTDLAASVGGVATGSVSLIGTFDLVLPSGPLFHSAESGLRGDGGAGQGKDGPSDPVSNQAQDRKGRRPGGSSLEAKPPVDQQVGGDHHKLLPTVVAKLERLSVRVDRLQSSLRYVEDGLQPLRDAERSAPVTAGVATDHRPGSGAQGCREDGLDAKVGALESSVSECWDLTQQVEDMVKSGLTEEVRQLSQAVARIGADLETVKGEVGGGIGGGFDRSRDSLLVAVANAIEGATSDPDNRSVGAIFGSAAGQASCRGNEATAARSEVVLLVALAGQLRGEDGGESIAADIESVLGPLPKPRSQSVVHAQDPVERLAAALKGVVRRVTVEAMYDAAAQRVGVAVVARLAHDVLGLVGAARFEAAEDSLVATIRDLLSIHQLEVVWPAVKSPFDRDRHLSRGRVQGPLKRHQVAEVLRPGIVNMDRALLHPAWVRTGSR